LVEAGFSQVGVAQDGIVFALSYSFKKTGCAEKTAHPVLNKL
jgi:hypothetical protein